VEDAQVTVPPKAKRKKTRIDMLHLVQRDETTTTAAGGTLPTSGRPWRLGDPQKETLGGAQRRPGGELGMTTRGVSTNHLASQAGEGTPALEGLRRQLLLRSMATGMTSREHCQRALRSLHVAVATTLERRGVVCMDGTLTPTKETRAASECAIEPY